MGNEMFQARLEDEFADRVHEYREKHHMNKSEAIRHLLRAGLNAEEEQEEQEEDAPVRGFLERLAPSEVIVVATVLLLAGGLIFLGATSLVASGSALLAAGLFYLAMFSLLGGTIGVILGVAVQLASGRRVRDLAPWRTGEEPT